MLADAKAKANATIISEESAVEVEVEDVVLTKQAEEGTDDLISEFRDLPSRLQETLIPDLARLSQHSKAYLSAANAGITDGVRPVLGGLWATMATSAASVAVLLLLPLFMLTALVRCMGPYLPLLHHALLLVQAYLTIYFAMLALTVAATGLAPLRFDHALGLAQMVVAACTTTPLSSTAPRQGPRPAPTGFTIVCACARAERMKKAYLSGTDRAAEEWKKS
uniref:Uncharacterized protein n=1 Tax=Zea mays TaxID=4577 RepID=A0A804Q4M6_MAIZE